MLVIKGFDSSELNCKPSQADAPYSCSKSSLMSNRQKGVESQEKWIIYAGQLPVKFRSPKEMETDIANYYQTLLSRTVSYTPELSKKFVDSIQAKAPDIELEQMKFAAGYACGDFAGTRRLPEGFPENFRSHGTPTRILILSPMQRIALGSDPHAIKAMSHLVLTVLDKYERAKNGNSVAGRILLDDVQDSFKNCGETKQKCEELGWDFLAVYATRGARVSNLFMESNRENGPVFAATGLIASMLSYLDGYAISKGKNPYSLPSTVRTTCDYTKPYHFWMAAYLAHRLQMEGASPEGILKAVHGVELIYEQFGGSAGKKAAPSVVSDQLHGWYNVETQKNIAFNDMGAYWALNQSHSLNGDQVFLKLYNSATRGIRV